MEKTDNLTMLRLEKERLNGFCTYQEKLITYRVDHFRAHYPEIIGETLLPFEKETNQKVNGLLDAANEMIMHFFPAKGFGGNNFPKLVLKLLQVALIRLVRKVSFDNTPL